MMIKLAFVFAFITLSSQIAATNQSYVGCFPCGIRYLINGLTSSQARAANPDRIYFGLYNEHLIQYHDMTIEKCSSVCSSFGFLYAGLNAGLAKVK